MDDSSEYECSEFKLRLKILYHSPLGEMHLRGSK